MKDPPHTLLRRKEPAFRELHFTEESCEGLTADAIVELLHQYPQLLQRPVIETRTRTFVARPIDRILEFLE